MKRTTEEVRYFECQKCGAIIKAMQEDPNKYVNPSSLRLPTECYEEQGGCGREATKFHEIKKGWIEKNKPHLMKNLEVKK